MWAVCFFLIYSIECVLNTSMNYNQGIHIRCLENTVSVTETRLPWFTRGSRHGHSRALLQDATGTSRSAIRPKKTKRESLPRITSRNLSGKPGLDKDQISAFCAPHEICFRIGNEIHHIFYHLIAGTSRKQRWNGRLGRPWAIEGAVSLGKRGSFVDITWSAKLLHSWADNPA